MTDIPLGGGPEFDRIRAIAAALGPAATGLGNDCAVLPPGFGEVVLSTDLSVEGVHFRREWLSLEEIGWRAASAALSDLAAAGAEPVGLTASVGAPRDSSSDELVELMRGVGAAAVAVGGRVLGGDLARAPAWVVDITVVGRSARPVGRSEARPGDLLWVTGTLGGARAALDAWASGGTPAAGARERFAHPAPRIAEGRWLAAHGAHAMLDISDGLGGDAAHLAAASEVRVEIDLEQIPVHPDAVACALAHGDAVQAFAARGGEDYELLVALPKRFDDLEARRFQQDTGTVLTRIGRIRRGNGVAATFAGVPVALSGHDHFA
ncbi:MAG: thiamine-phosphate kinase [Gemmatimonadales bacterium]|jgi:thiamine-monophosphate kinase|nr:MAG: thiamine-phosphate kinase [Gemmatimonadales bacterium]